MRVTLMVPVGDVVYVKNRDNYDLKPELPYPYRFWPTSQAEGRCGV